MEFIITPTECPPVKPERLQAFQRSYRTEQPCKRKRTPSMCKIRRSPPAVCRSRKRNTSRTKLPNCKESLKSTRSAPECVSSRKACNCQCYQVDLCTQEMINFCWLLLEPEALNRIRLLLHEQHGYTFEEADNYIENKQTNVLNNLRLMAIHGKVTPLGCNVINFLMARKSECSSRMQKHIQDIFNCFSNQKCCEMKQKKCKRNPIRPKEFQLHSILQRLVGDIQTESKRITKCCSHFRNNNSHRNLSKQRFTPWRPTPEKDCDKTKLRMCEPQCGPTSELRKHDDWMQCMKKLLCQNHKNSKMNPSECCEDSKKLCNLVRELMKYTEEDKSSTTRAFLKYPCRTVMRTSPSSKYAVITSCCEPELHVVKDQCTDVSEAILMGKKTQTKPDPVKQMRSQDVQTELKGTHSGMQTETERTSLKTKTDQIPSTTESDESEDLTSFVGGLLDNSKFDSKKPDTKTDYQTDTGAESDISFLKDFVDTSIENSRVQPKSLRNEEEEFNLIEDSYEQGEYIQSIFDDRLADRKKRVPADREELKADGIRDQPLLAADMEENGAEARQTYFGDKEGTKRTFDNDNKRPISFTENFYYESIENLENGSSSTFEKSIYHEATEEDCEDENPRNSIFINKRQIPVPVNDDAQSLSYHTPPYSTDHVTFNFEFNKEELMGRIFDLTDVQDTIISPNGSMYINALENPKQDGEGFQSTDLTACKNTYQPRTNSYYANKKMDMSEIPYNKK